MILKMYQSAQTRVYLKIFLPKLEPKNQVKPGKCGMCRKEFLWFLPKIFPAKVRRITWKINPQVKQLILRSPFHVKIRKSKSVRSKNSCAKSVGNRSVSSKPLAGTWASSTRGQILSTIEDRSSDKVERSSELSTGRGRPWYSPGTPHSGILLI